MSYPAFDADFKWCDVTRKLGHGTFGVVRLAKLRVTGELLAVKCFNSFVPRTAVLREAAIPLSLTHPNVVHHGGLAGCGGDAYLVMEHCVLGNMQSHNKAWGYCIPLDLVGHLQLTRHIPAV